MLIEKATDETTGIVHYTFSVSHIHKDANSLESVNVEGQMTANGTVAIYSPRQLCCEHLTAGRHLVIGQAGANRLHLRVDDAVFPMTGVTTDQIEAVVSTCETITIGGHSSKS